MDKTNELEKVLLEATKRLDINMFEEFYEFVEGYSDYKKISFIKDLEIALNKFKELGDTFLESNLGICNRCNKGCFGYQLIGNNSRNYIQILFDKTEKRIQGVKECTDLKTTSIIKDLNLRIYINHYQDPNSEDFVPF